MFCLNTVYLIGHLGADPEQLPIEDKIGVKFKIATNETFYKRGDDGKVGEPQTKTEWHTIKAFGQNAKYALGNIRKGDAVFIRGRMHYHEYRREDDNIRGRNPEVIALDLYLLNKLRKSHISTVARLFLDNEKTVMKAVESSDDEYKAFTDIIYELMLSDLQTSDSESKNN
jgi:single stranded DNA-binding protein